MCAAEIVMRDCKTVELCDVQGGAAAMFFSGCGVFYGIYKTCEYLDKASTQPFVRISPPVQLLHSVACRFFAAACPVSALLCCSASCS
jgi:hypothetical protein